MVALSGVLAVFGATLGILLALLNLREKLWPKTHPLEPALRDIATAVRERGPDFHLRLDKP